LQDVIARSRLCKIRRSHRRVSLRWHHTGLKTRSGPCQPRGAAGPTRRGRWSSLVVARPFPKVPYPAADTRPARVRITLPGHSGRLAPVLQRAKALRRRLAAERTVLRRPSACARAVCF
jgi:hypothetical protein